MKVHVTLKKQVLQDASSREKALDRVIKTGLTAIANRKRFERYGIITGDAGLDRMDALKRLDEVLAVEVDGEKAAS